MSIINNRKNDNNKKNVVNNVVLIIFIICISLTIGFSTMYSSLDIGQLTAYFRVNKDIRITNITLDSAKNNAFSNWEEYDSNSISAGFSLPESSSEVTYTVEITNLGNIEMGIFDIKGLPDDLKYSIDNYTLKEMLCDSNNSSQCKLGSRTYINITISYDNNSYESSNTDFNIKLDFDFKRFYKISYVNLDSSNLPTKAIESDDLEFSLNSPYPEKVDFTGNTSASYNSLNGKVTLKDIQDDVIITYYATSYFVSYNGQSSKLFNVFEKKNITSFSRNTTLSLNEVLDKVNKSTAHKISTNKDDENYPSAFDIYAWVENNNLYWWSEANVVYYHPDTLGAFRQMTNLLTVDLEGTNTSLVKNFAHWFDKDAKLTTINGKINTSGLVLQYNPSYNYGIDNDENGSSGYGLTYMFNDCKVLTSIDTSEIDTKNSSDLKRMFGGCAKLTSIDVSHFDTSNAKSMYWMFRKNESLQELDLRNFDTSNVESMFGMFVATNNLKTIYLGNKFNTSKVKQFDRMFYSAGNLTTIYSYYDFDTTSKVSSLNMFYNTKKIVGSQGTLDATTYDSSHTDTYYAKLAHNGNKGYLTPYSGEYTYTITYDVNGATNNNPAEYTENTETFSLNQPVKKGYIFKGWTGSNGDTPQLEVTIEKGSRGNKHYVAHFEKSGEDLFPIVFQIEGTCNFNGSNSNITGSTCYSSLGDHTDYTNSTYIDTNINLYNLENYEKDYEIYFEISNYNPNEQENPPGCLGQNTIMNSKTEVEKTNPGIVLRKNSSQIELKSFASVKNTNYTDIVSYKIMRIDKKIYYSINGSNLTLLDDNTSFNSPFDLSVWFGASKDSNGNAFRHFKGTLSNVYIRLGTYC